MIRSTGIGNKIHCKLCDSRGFRHGIAGGHPTFCLQSGHQSVDRFAVLSERLRPSLFAESFPGSCDGLFVLLPVDMPAVFLGRSLEIDGKFGPASKKAVLDFQKAKGVTPDGFPSKELLARLLRG